MSRRGAITLGCLVVFGLLVGLLAPRAHGHEGPGSHEDCTLCQLGLERGVQPSPAPDARPVVRTVERRHPAPTPMPAARRPSAYRSRAPPDGPSIR